MTFVALGIIVGIGVVAHRASARRHGAMDAPPINMASLVISYYLCLINGSNLEQHTLLS